MFTAEMGFCSIGEGHRDGYHSAGRDTMSAAKKSRIPTEKVGSRIRKDLERRVACFSFTNRVMNNARIPAGINPVTSKAIHRIGGHDQERAIA
jgi:hypothetical protein